MLITQIKEKREYKILRNSILLLVLIFFQIGYSQDSIVPISGGEFKQFNYADGKLSSEGYLVKGKPEGFWKNYYPSGILKSAGKRKNNLLSGIWKFYSEDYILQKEISYEKEKKNGSTKEYSAEGFMKSDFKFVLDTLHGIAFTYHDNGRVYEKIPYVKGKIHGEMKIYNEKGNIIGIVEYKNGIVYKRESINIKDTSGMKQGIWKDFYDDEKIKTEGKFVNNVKVGYWKEYNKRGLLLETVKYSAGNLVIDAEEVDFLDIRKKFHKNGNISSICNYNKAEKREGICRYFNDTGLVINARVYKNGIMMGEGMADADGIKKGLWMEYYESENLRAMGNYEAGLKLGEWKFYYENEKLEQKGNFAKGEYYDGHWEWYFPDESLWRDEYYVYGLENGPFKEYSDSGTTVYKGEYVEGLETGIWTYHLNDHKEVGKFRNGQREGLWKHYYYNEEQSIRFKGKYESGLAEGKHTFYYPNGGKWLEGKYEYGEKTGIWLRFKADFSVLLRVTYKEGKEVKLDGVKISVKSPRKRKVEEYKTGDKN